MITINAHSISTNLSPSTERKMSEVCDASSEACVVPIEHLRTSLAHLQNACDVLPVLSLCMECDAKAENIMEACNSLGTAPSDADVSAVLDKFPWPKPNTNRKSVLRPEHKDGVVSEQLGLTRARIGGHFEVSSATLGLKSVCRLLTRWATHNEPDMVFTTINLNKDYAAARHRDKGNLGPSLIRAPKTTRRSLRMM